MQCLSELVLSPVLVFLRPRLYRLVPVVCGSVW